jgi:protein O-mannosyl-transferase
MRIKIFEAIILGSIIALLATGTYYRNEIWKSPLNLWRDCAEKSPDKSRPRNNVAVELIQLGRYKEAISELKALLRADPKSPEALNNLATIYTVQGKYDEALSYLLEAIKACKDPRFIPTKASAHNNVGVLLVKMEGYDEAIIHFKEALRLMPNFPQAKENLMNIENALATAKAGGFIGNENTKRRY